MSIHSKLGALAAAILLSSLPLNAQRRATVSGYITDGVSGETLIGAGVLVESTSGTPVGAVTNVFGFYTLTIPAAEVSLQFSYVGYESQALTVDLSHGDVSLNIVLMPSSLQEAVVVAQKDAGVQSTYLGAVEIPIGQVQHTPVLFGEADVLKAIQLMPGVQGGGEGSTGLFVRGGGPDENLILLDGVPIYNVDHMLGILSVFQTEAVKKVTLYKGSFPARYGGRVSSIVDIRTNDGNMKEWHGSLGIGALTDKLHLEGPVISDKLSMSFSARGLHSLLYDPIIRLALRNSDTEYINYYFYDLNGKITWRLSDKDRFILGGYSGRDNGGVTMKESYSDVFSRTKMGIAWGNDVASLRWNHVFSSRLFANTTVAFNRYRMLMNVEAREKGDDYTYKFDIDYISGIRDWSGRIDFDFVPGPRHLVKFGTEYIYHTFMPQTLSAITLDSRDSSEDMDQTYQFGSPHGYYGHDISLYAEDDISVSDNLTVNPGVYVSLFVTDSKPYFNIQPRLSAKYRLDNGIAFKTGYARMAQYVHLLSSSSISLPLDLWVPITRNIKPVTSDQVSAGVYYDGIQGWEFSVEGYYKAINNLLEYKDGTVTIGSSTGWENKVVMGQGRAIGLEFLAQKNSGRLTGWLAYTLAKSDRIFPDGSINNGKRFPYKYDRRHNLNVNVTFKLRKWLDVNAAWSFASGGTTTVPMRRTTVSDPETGQQTSADYVEARNNFRLPSSHRLNLGMDFHAGRRWDLNLSIYNVYNHMNPNFTFVSNQKVRTANGTYENKLVMEQITILPFFPSFSATYTF